MCYFDFCDISHAVQTFSDKNDVSFIDGITSSLGAESPDLVNTLTEQLITVVLEHKAVLQTA